MKIIFRSNDMEQPASQVQLNYQQPTVDLNAAYFTQKSTSNISILYFSSFFSHATITHFSG